jgi:hypothetical protein
MKSIIWLQYILSKNMYTLNSARITKHTESVLVQTLRDLITG